MKEGKLFQNYSITIADKLTLDTLKCKHYFIDELHPLSVDVGRTQTQNPSLKVIIVM